MKAVASRRRRRKYLRAVPKSRTATCWRRRSPAWASRLTKSSLQNSRSPLVRQISITPGGQHGDGMARSSGPNATVMARTGSAEITSGLPVIQALNRPSTSDQDRKRGVGVILSFILISWERGSPLLNADPRKIPFKQRASHAVRFSLSHFAWILATQLSTGLLPARNRFQLFRSQLQDDKSRRKLRRLSQRL